jgi:hypothetical protein
MGRALRTIRARNQHEADNRQRSACRLFHAGFLLGLFFRSEHGDVIFFRNVDCLWVDNIPLYPKREKSS